MAITKDGNEYSFIPYKQKHPEKLYLNIAVNFLI